MQTGRKGKCENSISGDLEVQGNLAFLLIHPLIGQPSEEDPIGGVVGIDRYSDAPCDIESIAVDVNVPVQGVGDAGGADPGDQVSRLVAGEAGGNDDELIAAEASQGVGNADGATQVVGDVPQQLVSDVVAVGVVDEFEAVEIDHEEGGAG